MNKKGSILSNVDSPVKFSRLTIISLEILFIGFTAIIFFVIAGKFDLLEKIYEFSQQHEEYELDELLTVSVYLMLCFLIFSFRWLRVIYRSEKEQKKLYNSLIEARKEVKLLQGFLPICSHCKNIRNDAGAWQQLEAYIQQHSQATFTHSICDNCMKEHYRDIATEE